MEMPEVPARIYGKDGVAAREYVFAIDTRSNYLSLPLPEIEALGLRKCGGKMKVEREDGVFAVETYFAEGEFRGEIFGAIAVAAAIPMLGYNLLQNLRFRLNPATGEIEKVPDGVPHPPYL